MTKIGTTLCGFLSLLFIATVCSAAPRQLYGKSVIVSWGETISRRLAGEQQFKTVSVQAMAQIYISSVGRPFVRMSRATGRGSGSSEQVGASGHNPSGGTRVVQFEGHSLVIVSANNAGGARHVQIDFDGNFTSCTASAIVGRAAGVRSFNTRSLITGGEIEVQSATAGAASCSIKDGNVFEN